MVLTKTELISALQNEVRILLHLASKIDPEKASYQPSPSQRTTLDLMRYLVIMGEIHLRGALASSFSIDGWRAAWQAGEARSKSMSLNQAIAAIGEQPAVFAELLDALSEDDLRAPIEMFGTKASRGSMLVNLVLCHYAAYRMQLFLYLKASGRDELNTINLWAGVDRFPA